MVSDEDEEVGSAAGDIWGQDGSEGPAIFCLLSPSLSTLDLGAGASSMLLNCGVDSREKSIRGGQCMDKMDPSSGTFVLTVTHNHPAVLFGLDAPLLCHLTNAGFL